MEKILIGIPSYKCYGFSRLCIESLMLNTDVPYDILIIDNAADLVPQDISSLYYESLAEKYPNIKYHKTPGNLGCSVSWNLIIEEGFKHQYDYIAIFNTDIVLNKGWSSKILQAFKDNPDYLALGPVEINTEEAEELTKDHLRLSRSFVDNLEKEPSLLDDPNKVYQHLNYIYGGSFYNKATEFENILKGKIFEGSGFSSPVYRKEVFEHVGYFDERFYPAFFEDLDFVTRVLNKNIKTGKSGNAFAHHWGSITTAKSKAFTNRSIHNAMARRYHDKWISGKVFDCLRESCRSNVCGTCMLGLNTHLYPQNPCPNYQFSLTNMVDKVNKIKGKDVLEEDVR